MRLCLVVLTALSSFQIAACSCTGPVVFEKSLSEVVVWVEVLDRVSVPSTPQGRGIRPLTVLGVIEGFRGAEGQDTLYLLEDSGFECYKGLSDPTIGKQFILSGRRDSIPQFSADSSLEWRSVLVVPLCSEGELQVVDGRVSGFIKRNRYVKKREALSFKYMKVNALWDEYVAKEESEPGSGDRIRKRYERANDRLERRGMRLERRREKGRYHQDMSMGSFRRWLMSRWTD